MAGDICLWYFLDFMLLGLWSLMPYGQDCVPGVTLARGSPVVPERWLKGQMPHQTFLEPLLETNQE